MQEAADLSQKITDAEKTDQSDRDQIDSNDEIQHAGHDENQNPGDQRNQWGKSQIDIHGDVLSFSRGSAGYGNEETAKVNRRIHLSLIGIGQSFRQDYMKSTFPIACERTERRG